MLASRYRMALRPAQNTVRVRPQILRARKPFNARFQSSSPTAEKAAEAAKGGSGALAGGVAGGAIVFFLGYLYYHFSGAKTVVNSATQVQSYFNTAFKKSAEAVPEPNQALDWLRDTLMSYSKFIPGASAYVDSAFKDIDKIRAKHGDEVDKIVRKTYDDLKDVTKKGASIETVGEAWEILQKALKDIAALAGDAAEDILNNHPQLKEKVGGKFQELKQMGDEYGPEAKKQVDETWKQVQDVLKGGFSMATLTKIQNLIQEKTKELKKYGDQAWQKGMEQAKPLLDKQPELKETIEKNKDALLKGDLGQLWTKIQEAAKSGDTEDLKSFIKEQTDKAQTKAGGGLEQLLGMIPGGENIPKQFQQLQELGQKHGKEAESLVKSTIEDIKAVLQKKIEEGKKLKDKAEADAKKEASK